VSGRGFSRETDAGATPAFLVPALARVGAGSALATDDTHQRARVADAHRCLCIPGELDGKGHTRATSGSTKAEASELLGCGRTGLLLLVGCPPERQPVAEFFAGDDAEAAAGGDSRSQIDRSGYQRCARRDCRRVPVREAGVLRAGLRRFWGAQTSWNNPAVAFLRRNSGSNVDEPPDDLAMTITDVVWITPPGPCPPGFCFRTISAAPQPRAARPLLV
jgi:hypothetical protein